MDANNNYIFAWSQYSLVLTLLEKYGMQFVNKMLGKRSVEYDSFHVLTPKGHPEC